MGKVERPPISVLILPLLRALRIGLIELPVVVHEHLTAPALQSRVRVRSKYEKREYNYPC